jgi:SAM-dependent methyltransferase
MTQRASPIPAPPRSVANTGRLEPAVVLREIYQKYYPAMRENEIRHRVRRSTFHVNLIRNAIVRPESARVCDLGGLFGDVASACAALGMDAIFVDDFRDSCHFDPSDKRFSIHQEYRARAIARDVIADGIDFSDESIDVFSCFASMEHWHHSPKRLFSQVRQALKPGGSFVLSVPNCVDLVKRITVPLGRSIWSPMEEWYEDDQFRGHVREPSVRDLYYIARDMKLVDVKVLGRNWVVHEIRNPILYHAGQLADRLLQLRPTLCSEIYLVGRKPSGSE